MLRKLVVLDGIARWASTLANALAMMLRFAAI